MESLLEWGRSVLDEQPFSRLVGAELTSYSPGRAELRVRIRDDLRQQNGFVHGGVISYAADNALTYAAGSTLGPNVVTSEYKINYVRPALGEWLIARATVVHSGKTQAVCRCDVYVTRDGGESLCALAQGTITKRSEPR